MSIGQRALSCKALFKDKKDGIDLEAMEQILKDKKALVTGGSKGLGKAICLKLAQEGAQVAFTYGSDEQAAAGSLEDIKKISNKNHLMLKVDCKNLQENLQMTNKIKEDWGDLDILVNNAGKSEFIPLALMDEEDWDSLLDINLKGIYATTKAALPFFIRKKSGCVLNLSSLAGVRILAAPIHYCASKAGIKGFTESLGKEVGRYNIRVNCLAPGILEGGVARGIPENKLNDYKEQLALQRVGSFEEAAECAAFMVSDLNSYMSGHTLILEGGL